jgi:hypothetical protein
LIGGLRPARFWSSLKPSQPSRPGRLVLYWVLTSLLLPVAYAGLFVRKAVSFAPQHEASRAAMLRWAQQFANPQQGWGPNDIVQAGGPQAWVDRQRPPVGTLAYVRFVFDHYFASDVSNQLRIVTLYLAWPWLTLTALMIFRASMRLAKVRAVHVLRCTLYSCDAAPWLALGVAMLVPPAVVYLDWGRYIGFEDLTVVAPLFAAATLWRLSAAYRHYLQFDHPVATAAASQAVVTLVVLVYVYTVGFSFP